tara:strand:+ start:181 stop:666 length:486 start_codon:yes stop_codon:yes gene_type:complete
MNNTLLQRLDSAADTTGSSVYASNRHVEEVFLASEAVTAGDFLCLDLSKTDDSDKSLFVKKGTDIGTAAATGLLIGVCIATAASGENVRVLVRGIINANCATGVLAGDRLVGSSTAGRLEAKANIVSDGTDVLDIPFVSIVAYAVGAESGNVASVYVIPQF